MTRTITTPLCCCGSDDTTLDRDYGNGDGAWRCNACDATVYRMDGHVSYASARTMRAAQAAWDDATDLRAGRPS